MSTPLALLSGFGLAGSAGLNAYVPLLAVAIAGRTGVLTLGAPFDALKETWAIALLSVLLVVEVIVDKVPVADHANDVLQTFVRPAAGALVFAAEAGIVTDVPTPLLLGLGLVTALGVHGVKATTRPVVNTTTAGLGAPVVSVIEDVVAVVTSVAAILLPVLVAACILLGLVLALVVVRRRRYVARP